MMTVVAVVLVVMIILRGSITGRVGDDDDHEPGYAMCRTPPARQPSRIGQQEMPKPRKAGPLLLAVTDLIRQFPQVLA